MYTIVLAIRFPVQRLGVTNFLQTDFDQINVIEANHADDVLKIAFEPSVDLVILDPELLDLALHRFFEKRAGIASTVPVFVYSDDQERIFANIFIGIGAVGYLEQRCGRDQFIDAIRIILKGGTYLSDKMRINHNQSDTGNNLTITENNILYYLLKGHKLSKISTVMNISSSTASTHKSRAFRKLSINNVKQFLEIAGRNKH